MYSSERITCVSATQTIPLRGSHQKEIGKIKEKILYNGGGRSGSPIFLCFFGNHFFVLKRSKNAMKDMILSFKMKGDVLSDHFLRLWFQKDWLDTVGFRTLRGVGV